MSFHNDEHIDELILNTIQEHMDDAGEPRPDLLWAGILDKIADEKKKSRSPRPTLARFGLSKWRSFGITALAACLLAAAVLFPEHLTALGKRVFFTAQVVEDTGEGSLNIATGRYPKDEAQILLAPDAPPMPLEGTNRLRGSSSTDVSEADFPDEQIQTGNPEVGPITTMQADPEEETPQNSAEPRIFAASLPEVKAKLTLQEARATAPFPVRYPAYVPTGFRESDIAYQPFSEQNGEVQITFAGEPDEQAAIRFTQLNLVGSYASGQGYDPDQTALQQIQINGNEGTLLVTEAEQGVWSNLSWFEGDMVYKLEGPIQPEKIIKMAESLQP